MKTLRILLADDHDIVREGLRALLASHPGWQVCGEAVNGREAVARARELRPDVVVLDFSMPEMNGLEAARQIHRALPKTEILVLTMHESDQLAQQVFDAGARSLILKTDTRRYLLLAVEALARHQPFFTPAVSALVMRGCLQPETPPAKAGRPDSWLTPREREIVQLVAEGRTTKEVAVALGVSEKTAETHRANLMKKIGVHSVAELVRYAIRNQIIQP
jgi:DNA-binding NarL/FixJ family response regulator